MKPKTFFYFLAIFVFFLIAGNNRKAPALAVPVTPEDSLENATVFLPLVSNTVPIGTSDNPIQILFNPSTDTQVINNGGQILANALHASTGLYFEVKIPDTPKETIQAMCAAPDRTMGFLPSFGYVFARELCGVDAAFKAVRFGYGVYWAQFMVSRDSTLTTLDDLDNLHWAYPYKGSMSGYIAPLAMLKEANVITPTITETGSHVSAVLALYNGEADFSTSFYSSWIPPDGVDPWQYGDPPDVPDEVVDQCTITNEGHLVCGGYRIQDARASIANQHPDVVQKLRILTISPPIANDLLAFGPYFPQPAREAVAAAFLIFSQTEDWGNSIGSPDIYNWTGVETATDQEYDFVRMMMEAIGLKIEDL